MYKFYHIIFFLLAFGTKAFSQDTLDSIAKVQTMVQVDELQLRLELGIYSPEQYSEKLESMAKSGNAAAQNMLSSCYIDGKGIPKDPKMAFFWATKAAENGNLKALNALGFCYENGIGTEQDLFQAFSFYKKAALRGMPTAFTNIAQCYLQGMGTKPDTLKARAWFEKGAEYGERVAQNNAGYLYLIENNYEKAFFWLTKAAEQGSPAANEMLGDCFEHGIGTEKDHKKAMEFYKKSYMLGNTRLKELIDNEK